MTSFEDQISLMIPVYLRGDLSDVERAEVEKLAAQNPEIAADIEFQKSLKDNLIENMDSYEPGDMGWARLSKAMDQAEASEKSLQEQPKFWRYAAAILAVAAIGQAGVLGSMALNNGQDVQYETASGSNTALHMMTVGFDWSVTTEQLTKVLQDAEGTITAGPSALGLYEIKFQSEQKCLAADVMLKSKDGFIDTMTSCG